MMLKYYASFQAAVSNEDPKSHSHSNQRKYNDIKAFQKREIRNFIVAACQIFLAKAVHKSTIHFVSTEVLKKTRDLWIQTPWTVK